MNTNITNRFVRRVAALAAMAVVPALAVGLSPVANAGQPAPFGPCDTSPSSTNLIWDGVNPATHTPTNSGKGNVTVVWPHDDKSRGYAVHYGNSTTHTLHDLLVVPTVRELGIECPNLLQGDAPEYFTEAYEQRGLMTGNDWVLAINSESGRRIDQLHIHLTQLDRNTRADIDQALKDDKVAHNVAHNEGDWSKSLVTLRGTDTHGNYVPRDVRMWEVGTMNHNFFEKLNDNIVKKLHTRMADETLLITSAPGGKGFIVLSSDTVSGLKHGVNNIETFLHKT
jgi:CDP-diacylglycerol pyrophosphatase